MNNEEYLQTDEYELIIANDLFIFVSQLNVCEPCSIHRLERVELEDSEMKSGNLSLILKNIKIRDDGTYECHVVQSETDKLSVINLVCFKFLLCFTRN